jgi:hypothetical protein
MRVTSKKVEQVIGAYFPPPIAQFARRLGVYPRYAIQAKACRNGFKEFGHLYPQQILFIAGLPKSGTSWFSSMVASYPGFHELLIPEQTIYDLRTGGSHDFELPADMFARFRDMLVVTKMHVHGSSHNADVLHRAGVKYVVLYRDLRDVAVSGVFYLRRMRWHPEYRYYASCSIQGGLAVFAKRTLSSYVRWVRAWHNNLEPELGLELRYEDILTDPYTTMTQVALHFGLDSSSGKITSIVKAFQFQNVSGGRVQGQENDKSFFRKGVAGDWRNHFTPELVAIYQEAAGEFLVEFGYEEDYSW